MESGVSDDLYISMLMCWACCACCAFDLSDDYLRFDTHLDCLTVIARSRRYLVEACTNIHRRGLLFIVSSRGWVVADMSHFTLTLCCDSLTVPVSHLYEHYVQAVRAMINGVTGGLYAV